MRTLIICLRDKAENKDFTYLKSGSPVDGSPELINVFKLLRALVRDLINGLMRGFTVKVRWPNAVYDKGQKIL
jgi:hypothetical protein